MLKKIKEFFLIFKTINKINQIKPKFLFYSESKSYLKFGYLIIEYLAKKFPGEVYYVSSDAEDKINNLDVINVHISSGFLLQYFFTSVSVENLFMTLTDLNNSIIKKNKFVKNYIYYFHGAVSTTKIYTSAAFDNYDTILCNGDYQIREIQQRESIENLKKKKLIKTGFFYFDYLTRKIDKINSDNNEILVAPSWNKDKKNFINEDFEKIIEKLLDDGHKVRFRPHPETIKRSKKLMSFYKKKFHGDNFIFDDFAGNFEALTKAKCLITDNSGISIEYMLIFKRPAIYYGEFDKIHNEKFDMYKNLNTMDDLVKNKFGYKIYTDQINNINYVINKSILEFKKNEIDKFLNENFYNYGKTVKFFDDNFSKIFN